MDSSIRLRQINQSELSGFVSGILAAFSYPSTYGNLISTGSGVFNLGSTSFPYAQAFVNQLNLPSGSGIYFGNTSFNAYVSGGIAFINVGGISISSNEDAIFIQGPSGNQGPSGATGATGPTGISVTGISYNTSTNILEFSLSNNTNQSFNFQGLSGATGVSVTGFYQSGSFIYPQFSNFRGLGSPVELVAGPPGPPGSISFFFAQDGSNQFYPVTNFPTGVIINPYYYTTPFPPISLMRGMSYTIDSSGLGTHNITSSDLALMSGIFSGQSIPFTVGTPINYYTNPANGTGYWRLAFFPSGTPTGAYNSITSPSLFTETSNTQVYGTTITNNVYRTNFSFNTSFTAQNAYKYGFMIYTLGGNDTTTDAILDTNTGYAYVLGNAYFSSGIGPVGPQGPSGVQGPVGPQGNIGPSGQQGTDGLSVVSYNEQQIGPNSFQIQFIFNDGSIGPWINLPSGGPSGTNGAQGPVGSLANYFSGVYSNTNTYITNSVITLSGSSYLNTGVATLGTPPPSSPWQLLAQAGAVGPSGATGFADKYSSSFNVVSGEPTGAGAFASSITGLTVNGVSVSGIAAKFTTGQVVSFYNSGLIGYAYTPFQSILVSTSSHTGSYFYGTVNSFVPQSGLISLTVATGLSNITGILNTTIDASNNILWYNYSNATINLGANLMSGAIGPVGPQGVQGPPGGISIMRCAVYTGSYNFAGGSQAVQLQPTGLNTTGGSGIDIFNILITGNGTQPYGAYSYLIDFNWNYVNTGQSIILKIRNSGVPNGNAEPPLFSFSGVSSNIMWPGGIFTCPNDGEAYIYTLLRFPDEFGQMACYATYSNPYYFN